MAEEGSWDTTCVDWLVTPGHCCAGGFAAVKEGETAAGMMWAASDWALLYKEDHEEEELQEDGETVKKTTINEPSVLHHSATKGTKPTGGLWVGGEKYKVIKAQSFDCANDETFQGVLCQKTKGGLFAACTKETIVVGIYDENKGQNSGNCINCVLKCAEYLSSIGY
eukprot:NODE_19691_length_831_cov_15.950284.p1 GENE.NODE_19691_length_831_cov_15.950284~~NODE_19691_length_831_cov_15.950284.p1  ORF type:complete len:167 (+),score=35.80 NODE_19691_length_831_cov_15.950284:122-622(+)